MLGLSLVLGGALLGAVALIGLSAYGRLARGALGEPSRALPVEDDRTELDRAAGPLAATHPGATGVSLVADNLDAFAVRAATARQAGRSLDLQYYYWRGDLTGSLLAREVLAAADRGVKVRLLIDDISLRRGDPYYRAIDSHPQIEVRLFNPSRNRASGFHRGVELVLRFVTATRRMHNKAWIADGRVAVVGGRNIGDAYFDAARGANFHDMDLLLVGEALTPAQAIFDAYWNSEAAVPIRVLTKRRTTSLAEIRRRHARKAASEAAAAYLERADRWRLAATRFLWPSKVELVADDPEKALGRDDGNRVVRRVRELIDGAGRTAAIISPYFIPGRSGVEALAALRERGVDVSVLTNSLAATDVVAVHGAYARYRKPLLARGIALHELRPERPRERASLFGSSTASLHTKAFVVDGETAFVGSFNFDPRSAALNTEMGVVVRDAELSRQILAHFRAQTRPEASYRLSLKGGSLRWNGSHGAEPSAGFWRRLAATAIGCLPIESQL